MRREGVWLNRNYQPLAISTPVDSVWVNPQQLSVERDGWSRLLELLHLEADYLHDLIADRIDREFVYLKRARGPGGGQASRRARSFRGAHAA